MATMACMRSEFGGKLLLVGALALAICGCSRPGKGSAVTPEAPPPSTGVDSQGSPAPGAWPQGEGSSAKSGAFAVKLIWDSPVTANAYLRARLLFLGKDHRPAQSVSLTTFDPRMPAMGHGTDTQDQKFLPVPDHPDQAQVEQVYFIMGGAWEVTVAATVDGVADVAKVHVEVP